MEKQKIHSSQNNIKVEEQSWMIEPIQLQDVLSSRQCGTGKRIDKQINGTKERSHKLT